MAVGIGYDRVRLDVKRFYRAESVGHHDNPTQEASSDIIGNY